MAAPRIRGFTHVSLSVGNLEASLNFYRGVLGLEVLAETFDGVAFEGREAMLVAGRTDLCLQEHRSRTGGTFDPKHPGLDHISFVVESMADLEAFADHLTATGVVHSGVKPLPGFGNFIEFRDPDEILVELHCVST